jgi:hypothetical protein
MEEGGVVVRGTSDPAKARTTALRSLMAHWLVDLYPTYPQDHPDDYLETALYYARRLRDRAPDPGRLFRWTPCSPKTCGDHSRHLWPATAEGSGVWPGVYWWEV